jgi:hypothetical protein
MGGGHQVYPVTGPAGAGPANQDATHEQWELWLAHADAMVAAAVMLADGQDIDPGVLPDRPAGAVPEHLSARTTMALARIAEVAGDLEDARRRLLTRMSRESAWTEIPEPRQLETL